MSGVTKFIIKDDSSEFDLHQLFNSLSMMSVNTPALGNQQPQYEHKDEKGGLLNMLSSVNDVQRLLRFLTITKTETFKRQKTLAILDNGKQGLKSSKKTYIRPTHDPLEDEKTFWMVKDSVRSKLLLDAPKFVITLPNDYILAIERKCISLYEADGHEIDLKDYDSAGIGKKTTLCEVKYINFNGRDYILLFGNDKEGSKTHFGVLVYQIVDSRLIFVKKSTIWESEVSSPVILFDSYPKHEKDKFCLVAGGYTDNRQKYNYHALQINLYLLVQENVQLTPANTTKVDFSSRTVVLAGKALEFNDYWYVFSSENQQVAQLKLRYEQGGILNQIEIQSENLGFGQKIYFCEDNLHLGFKGAQHMVVMLNRNIDFRFKPFDEIMKKFKFY